MKEVYTVKHIWEDDFGCEDREKGHEPQVLVVLQDREGHETTVRQPDSRMYRYGIGEGDRVYLEEGGLRKEAR
jgi:hypothetical protein